MNNIKLHTNETKCSECETVFYCPKAKLHTNETLFCERGTLVCLSET